MGVLRHTTTRSVMQILMLLNLLVTAVSSTSIVATLAGTDASGATDGSAAASTFGIQSDVVRTSDGSILYIADTGNNKIRALDLVASTVSTIAGSGQSGYADGFGTNANFSNTLRSLALTGDDDTLFVADGLFVRYVLLETGKVGTLAGVFMDKPYSQDGSSLQDQVSFGGVYSLALSSDDSTLYVGDYGFVRRLTILGSGGELYTDASTLSISLSQVPSISYLYAVTALALSE